MGKWTDEALRMLPYFRKGAQNLSDDEALEVKGIYDEWEVGIDVKVHEKRIYGGKLYRCLTAHTTQADWTPDASVSLWAVINESHAGTIDDPIPAQRNMEYTYFLYYLDPEDNNIYLCQYGDTDTQGSIVLAYLPHEVVGLYFKLVER